MRIGLVDVDGHAKKKKWGATVYPNLALCKIARWHKQQGDDVEWAIGFEHYDRIYMSKVFNFSPDDLTAYDADEIIRGGTGYDIESRLPDEIDRTQPDYSIYPAIPSDTAYGFLTRGCPNKCRWCVVPRKEGRIVPYMDVDEIAIEGRTKLVLMDNNILAAGDYAKQQILKIIERGYKVDFNQALDARLVTDEWAQLLAKVKWLDKNRIRFGCDTHVQIAQCERAMEMIIGYGFHGEFFLYTMLNDNMQECYERIQHWWRRLQNARKNHTGNWVYAYAQPYRDPYNPHRPIPQWQKDMAGWVNKKAHFVAHSFEEFEPRKGFRCIQYFKKPTIMITIKKENEKICGKCCWFFLKGIGALGICTYRPTRECWYSKECATPEHYVPKQQLRHYQAVLIQANRYRRDQNVPSIYRMPDPTELGKAIDFAVEQMRVFENLFIL